MSDIELVDRAKVLEIVSAYCPDDDGSCSKADADPREMLDEIEALPIIDAEPVKHGEWIKTDVCENQFKCSECGRTVTTNTSIVDPADFEFYCYNCGAKMDGDADND